MLKLPGILSTKWEDSPNIHMKYKKTWSSQNNLKPQKAKMNTLSDLEIHPEGVIGTTAWFCSKRTAYGLRLPQITFHTDAKNCNGKQAVTSMTSPGEILDQRAGRIEVLYLSAHRKPKWAQKTWDSDAQEESTEHTLLV